jgi:cytochrome c-type biogenesis protein CcmF
MRLKNRRQEHNFTSRRAVLEVSRDGHVLATLAPELRYYEVRRMQTTEAALYSSPIHDIYIVLGETSYSEGDASGESTLGVRMYVTPGQQFVWIGFLLAAIGGFIAMLTRLQRKGET